MCAKYSAEWWEKIPDITREISSRRDPSRIVDDLIQETASGRASPTRKSERSRAGFAALRLTPLRLHVEGWAINRHTGTGAGNAAETDRHVGSHGSPRLGLQWWITRILSHTSNG